MSKALVVGLVGVGLVGVGLGLSGCSTVTRGLDNVLHSSVHHLVQA